MAYDARAQEFAYGFYARGWSKAKALPEIQKVYPGFAGSTWDDWVTRYDWKTRRAAAEAKIREFEDTLRDTTRVVLMELNELRLRLLKALQTTDLPDTQAVYAYTKVCQQIVQMSQQYNDSRDSSRLAMDTLDSALTKLITELREFPDVAKALEAHSGEVGREIEAICEQFGRAAA